MTTTVSIVVDNYNYEGYVDHAITSALDQQYAPTEVVVVDDGSTDASLDVIARFGDAVRVVAKENGGQASAFNAGLQAARGEIVIFLDADDALFPTAAAAAVDHFASLGSGAVKVSWPLVVIDGCGRDTGRVLPDRELPEGDLRETVLAIGPDSYLSSPTSGNAWRRSFLDAVAPIPEGPYRKGADGYLITLAPLFGVVGAVHDPQGAYRVHGGNQYWRGTTEDRIAGSLERYEVRAASLASVLASMNEEADVERWRQRNPYYQWLTAMRQTIDEVKGAVPVDSTFVLLDQGEWGEPFVRDRHGVSLSGGAYNGAPATAVDAVGLLQERERDGIEYLVVGSQASWWLDHYAEFGAYVRAEYETVTDDEHVTIFRLREARR